MISHCQFYNMRLFKTTKGAEYDSFLNCIKAENKSAEDIDPTAILEFLTFGSVYGNKTFFKGIKKKTTHQPYGIDKNEGLIRLTYTDANPLKETQPIKVGKANNKIVEYFLNRKHWLKGKKVTVDLTGGIDSRMVASILLFLEIPFDAVYSISSGNDNELEIVNRLTTEAGVSLEVIPPVGLIESPEEIRSLIELGDGQWDPVGLRSLSCSQAWRNESGYELALTGVGGELYKDFWWQQDFPFYHKSQPDFDRLLNMRMYPANIPDEVLGSVFRETQGNYLRDFKNKLTFYSCETNSRTYDQIYYHLRIKEQISVLSHASAAFLPVWSPLLEPELLNIGYNLRRRDRFMSALHREVISFCTPHWANIPTTDGGMTVSNRPVQKASDLARFFRHKTRRGLSRIKKNEPNTSKKTISDLILHEEIENAIRKLKQVNILAEQTPNTPEKYSSNLHGRLVLLGYLTEFLDT